MTQFSMSQLGAVAGDGFSILGGSTQYLEKEKTWALQMWYADLPP